MEHKEEKMEESGKDSDEETRKWWKGPIKIIIGLFLLLIVVLWLVPYYSIKMNPEPSNIPNLSQIQSSFLEGVEIGNNTGIKSISQAGSLIREDNAALKQAATRIAAGSCTESRLCHAKALYYFTRDNIKYVSDPVSKEYIASPLETLKTGGGDCDDGAVMLAAMLEAVGIRAEIEVIPGHAFTKAIIPEAPENYKIDGWVNMDWTCSSCRFGELPYNDVLQLSD